MRESKLIVRFISAVALMLWVPFAAATLAKPEQAIDGLYKSFLQLVDAGRIQANTPESDIFALMEQELGPVVDFSRIAKKVMGKYSRQASDEQLNRFTLVFKKTLVSTYSKGLEKIDLLDRVEVSAGMLDSSGDRAQVPTAILLKDGSVYNVVYSMFENGSGWNIDNIVVEGVNLGLVFRNQFAHYMQQYGNRIDDVIVHWGE